MSTVLLDTSGYRALKRSHPKVIQALEAADGIILSPIVIGEILSGFDPGTKSDANRKFLWEFVASAGVEVIPLDGATAERYSAIYDFLRHSASPISPNDLWIAASAMQYGLRVITLDRDFLKVPQILVDCFNPV